MKLARRQAVGRHKRCTRTYTMVRTALETGSHGTKPFRALGGGDMLRLPRTGPLLEVRLADGNISSMDCGEDRIFSSPSAGPIWIAHS